MPVVMTHSGEYSSVFVSTSAREKKARQQNQKNTGNFLHMFTGIYLPLELSELYRALHAAQELEKTIPSYAKIYSCI